MGSALSCLSSHSQTQLQDDFASQFSKSTSLASNYDDQKNLLPKVGQGHGNELNTATSHTRLKQILEVDNTGRNELEHAVLENASQTVELLLQEKQIDVDSLNKALYYAISPELTNHGVAAALIQAGADVNTGVKTTGNKQVFPLSKAFQTLDYLQTSLKPYESRSHLYQHKIAPITKKLNALKKTINLLLHNGSNVNIEFQASTGACQKNTPLHYAIAQKNKDLVVNLLAAGADIFMKNDIGQSGPFIASGTDDPQIFKIVHKAAEQQNALKLAS